MLHVLSVWLLVAAFFGAGRFNAIGTQATKSSFIRCVTTAGQATGTRPEAGHEDDTPTLQRWNGTAGGPKGTLPSRKAEAVIRIGHGFVPLLLGGGDGAVQTSDADLV